MLEAEGNL